MEGRGEGHGRERKGACRGWERSTESPGWRSERVGVASPRHQPSGPSLASAPLPPGVSLQV